MVEQAAVSLGLDSCLDLDRILIKFMRLLMAHLRNVSEFSAILALCTIACMLATVACTCSSPSFFVRVIFTNISKVLASSPFSQPPEPAPTFSGELRRGFSFISIKLVLLAFCVRSDGSLPISSLPPRLVLPTTPTLSIILRAVSDPSSCTICRLEPTMDMLKVQSHSWVENLPKLNSHAGSSRKSICLMVIHTSGLSSFNRLRGAASSTSLS
eukprot:CAMPEP_0177341816 /NCGR_PEP_ID=MMETSP0368-20130122/26707_1 /TAXON_ID=447022 ORGANISM="Scrippsiella hangoei-like, Strain SHHI-4" /NCGR_SAMPLE_ID=MMETSP0368 /ASSEMBLY_ACC=CAM_ASM_000363 /LENGTH=212 /DNA_ID=CAMNT_0018803133 /DNA_START=141 /DNA_END=780 /DNA_ORIENTATION=-